MQLTVVSPDRFSGYIAKLIIRQALLKPDSVFCFATGNTTKPIFDETVRLKRALDVDFSKAFAVNLDEYVGVSRDDPASACWRIRHDLYEPLGIDEERFYVPSTGPEQAQQECERFGALLERLGGIDLMLLSVGGNGHIAFNEPGTPFESGIHVAGISQSTVDAKKELFGGADKVPKYGVTMGVSTVMQARRILLVANGTGKAGIMERGLYGPVTPDVPVSVIQLHPDTTAILDEAAAGRISSLTRSIK